MHDFDSFALFQLASMKRVVLKNEAHDAEQTKKKGICSKQERDYERWRKNINATGMRENKHSKQCMYGWNDNCLKTKITIVG
jgi:hypothetical protein